VPRIVWLEVGAAVIVDPLPAVVTFVKGPLFESPVGEILPVPSGGPPGSVVVGKLFAPAKLLEFANGPEAEAAIGEFAAVLEGMITFEVKLAEAVAVSKMIVELPYSPVEDIALA
jgi:hypothetical protein